jgi:hypothetical protein
LCPTSQDPLDSERELLSGFKDSMKAEFSSLNSRLSVLESSTKVRVDPVPPSPSRVKPQEASKLEESFLGLGGEAKGTFATSLMRV